MLKSRVRASALLAMTASGSKRRTRASKGVGEFLLGQRPLQGPISNSGVDGPIPCSSVINRVRQVIADIHPNAEPALVEQRGHRGQVIAQGLGDAHLPGGLAMADIHRRSDLRGCGVPQVARPTTRRDHRHRHRRGVRRAQRSPTVRRAPAVASSRVASSIMATSPTSSVDSNMYSILRRPPSGDKAGRRHLWMNRQLGITDPRPLSPKT